MKKAVLRGIAAVVVLAALAGSFWLGTQRPGTLGPGGGSTSGGATQGAGKGAPAANAGGGSIAVEVAKVATVSLPQTITAVGSLRSDESVTLRPEVAGRISAIGFKEGQRVAKGAPLVQLDSAVPEAETQQARANVKLAKS